MSRPYDPELGVIDTTIWHLEVFRPPLAPPIQPPDSELEVVRMGKPTVRFYRYLYESVGADWFWCSRRLIGDETLEAAITAPTVDIRILWRAGVPAGFAEIDFRAPDDVELVYFGLMPEAVGLGYGKFFLDWTIRHAFAARAQRLWVHTCDLDHPRARSVYESLGFEHFDTEHTVQKIIQTMPVPEHVSDRVIKKLS